MVQRDPPRIAVSHEQRAQTHVEHAHESERGDAHERHDEQRAPSYAVRSSAVDDHRALHGRRARDIGNPLRGYV